MRSRGGLAFFLLALGLAAVASPSAGDEGRVEVVPVRPLDPGRARATGRIVPRWSAQVGSRLSGLIATWGSAADGSPIDVGTRVAKGQVLFQLRTAPLDAQVAMARAGLSLAKASLAALRSGSRAERIEALRASVAEIDVRLADLARDEERYRRLVEEDKTVPARKLQEVQAQVASLQAQREGSAARLREAEAGPTPTEIGVAEARVAQAEAQVAVAELDLKDTTITAPFDGVVTGRHRTLGDYVASAPFISVLDLVSDREIEAELKLPESFLGDVAANTTEVTIESPLLAAPLRVRVSRVVTAVDPVEGVFSFRAPVPEERAGGLVPGAFVQGVIELTGKDARVVIPPAAVQTDVDGRSWTFVARKGAMHRVAVTVSERLSDGVVIQAGLKTGDSVVVGPPAALLEGAPLPAAARPK